MRHYKIKSSKKFSPDGSLKNVSPGSLDGPEPKMRFISIPKFLPYH